MSNPVKCVGCPAMLTDPIYPEYKVRVTGHRIRPKARCNHCRAAYEAQMLNKPVGGLIKLSTGEAVVG